MFTMLLILSITFQEKERVRSYWSNQYGPFYVRNVHGLDVEQEFGQRIIAGTNNALLKSENAGDSWQVIDLPAHFKSIVFVPGDSQKIWAGGGAFTLYFSTDGGSSWEPKSIPIMSAFCLAISEVNTDFMYAGTNFSSGGRIAISEDGGTTWVEGTIPNIGRVWFFEPHPIEEETVFAGGERGLFHSFDAGQTWTSITKGLPADSYVSYEDMVFRPDDASRAYLVCGSNNGPFMSQDGGLTWQDISIPSQPKYHWSVDIPMWDIEKLFVGGFYSTQETAYPFSEWTPIFFADSVERLRCGPNQQLFLGTRHNGIFRSLDGGATFDSLNAGLSFGDLRTVIFHPTQSGLAYAAGWSGGIFKTTNNGRDWELVRAGGSWLSIQLCLSNPKVIYACGGSPNMMKSMNGGKTWDYLSGLSGQYINLAVDPADPEHAITLSHFGASHTMFHTTNGLDWEPIPEVTGNAYSYHDILFDPFNNKNVYITLDNGIHYSADGGKTWEIMNSGNFSELGIYDDEGVALYGLLGNGAYRSTDHGLTWTLWFQSPNLQTIKFIQVDSLNQKAVAILTNQGSFFKSSNGGNQWRELSQGLIATDIQDLAVNFDDGSALIATYDRSIYAFVCDEEEYVSYVTNWPQKNLLAIVQNINRCSH